MADRNEAGPAETSLAGRVRAAPLLSDAAAARGRLGDLLQSDKKTAARLAAVLPAQSDALALIEGAADGSSFLWDIARADPAALAALLEQSPEASLDRIVEAAGAAARVAKHEDEVMRALRLMRREAALLVALCDIGGVWSVAEVTGALTRIADTAINSSVDYLLRAAHMAGKIRLPDPE